MLPGQQSFVIHFVEFLYVILLFILFMCICTGVALQSVWHGCVWIAAVSVSGFSLSRDVAIIAGAILFLLVIVVLILLIVFFHRSAPVTITTSLLLLEDCSVGHMLDQPLFAVA